MIVYEYPLHERVRLYMRVDHMSKRLAELLTRQTALDPRTGRSVRLFHPRQQKWNHHFRWSGEKVIGITAVGRATIEALGMNSEENQIIRTFERILARHPPPGHL